MLVGVFIAVIIWGAKISAPTESTDDNIARVIIAVLTAVFISRTRPAPKSCEMIIEHPAFEPKATAIKIMVTGYEAPMAASALSPANLPAITLSAIV